MTPLLRPEAPPWAELPIHTLTPNPAALYGGAGVALSQGSPERDPADHFFCTVIPGGGHEAHDDHGDDEALAGD